MQLLAWLAHHGDWAERAQLAALLWPDLGADAARRNLRKVLFRIRSHAGLPAVEELGSRLRWAVATDVQAFEAALDSGDRAAALALWRGEPWQGLGAEALAGLGEWLAFERTRLGARWRAAVLEEADAALARDAPRAAALAHRLLAADRLDEEALRLRLRALHAQGLRHEAEAAYRHFATTLADALGLEPTAETRALRAMPVVSVEPPLSGVLAHDTSAIAFVGRRSELRELAALLSQPGCRWITLVGAGGTGKTRLLQRALPELSREFTDGDVWVSCEDLQQPAQVAARLAECLKLPLQPQRSALGQVAEHLAGRHLLLALDNLEHLPQAGVEIATALAGCAGVQVVATSRMRLGIPGEWLLPLQGLPWPGPEDADRAEAFDAVRLFAALARVQRPGFDAAAESAAIVQLCAAVDGLPLALTLAAVWTRQFDVADLVAALGRSAEDVLRMPEPGVPARQHSMEACLEHSWQLLVPAERLVLARLSVFRGGFTAEAARHVAGATLPLLAALVDKSLVQRSADDSQRHVLHPLTAEYASRRLEPEARLQAEQAHAAYFLQQMARIPQPQRPGERAAFYAAATADAVNILQAWRYGCEAGLADALGAATVGFVSHLHERAQFAAGLAALRAAEAVLAGQPLAHARLGCAQALLANNLGDFALAHEVCRLALPVARRARDAKLVRICLDHMAMAAMQTGRNAEARRRYVQLQQLAEHAGDRLMTAHVLHAIAMLDSDAGRHDAALATQRRVMALLAELGGARVLVAQELGQMLRVAGQPTRAAQEMKLQLAACDAQTLGHERSMLLGRLAAAELDLGELDAADRHACEARAVNTEGALPMWDATLTLLSSRIDLRLARPESAWDRLVHAAAAVRRANVPSLKQQLALHAALWLHGTGRDAEAARLLVDLLRQPGLDQSTCREAQALAAGADADADAQAGPAPDLMTLIDQALPLP